MPPKQFFKMELDYLKLKGENDADQEVVYAKITGKIQDASDTTEDGLIEFANRKAGSNVITARLRSDSFQLLNDTNLVVRGLTYPTADGTAAESSAATGRAAGKRTPAGRASVRSRSARLPSRSPGHSGDPCSRASPKRRPPRGWRGTPRRRHPCGSASYG